MLAGQERQNGHVLFVVKHAILLGGTLQGMLDHHSDLHPALAENNTE